MLPHLKQLILEQGPKWQSQGIISSDSIDWLNVEASVLPAGLTNKNYKLNIAGDDYVLRLSAENSDALDLNREREFLIHQQAAKAGLIPAVLYRSSNNDYWLRRYVSGSAVSIKDVDVALLSAVSQSFKYLHLQDIKHDLPLVDLQYKANAYWKMIDDEEKSELVFLQEIIDNLLAQNKNLKKTLCHLDPTLNNWLKTTNGLVLLDWEYAGVGNPLWDYALFSEDAKLDAAQEKLLLIDAPDHSEEEWMFAKKQMRSLSLLWYKAQRLISSEEFIEQCESYHIV